MSATSRGYGHLCTSTTVRVTMAVLVVSALWPIEVLAQPAPATPARPWDAAVLAGALLGRPEATSDRGYDEWFGTPQVALVAGRHLTAHLKCEVEVSTSREGRQFVQEAIAIPNSPVPLFISTERLTRVSAVQASVVYQFFENQWAHPFVHVGVVAASERVRTHRFPQHLRIGPTDVVVVRGDDGPTTAHRVGLTVGAGTKLYVTPRLFVRADAQLTAFAAATHLTFRAGLGIDF